MCLVFSLIQHFDLRDNAPISQERHSTGETWNVIALSVDTSYQRKI